MFRRRRSSTLSAVLCCWLFLNIGRAEPAPDFAINVAITGSGTVSSLALETKVLYQTVGGTVLDLQAGYKRLETAKVAMTSIANQLSAAGVTLSQAISTMALNNSGPIATYFDSITNAISALQTLITTGLTGQINTLNGIINTYVSAKLRDTFHTMSLTLATLSQSVASLRAAVTSARTAAGSSPTVSSTIAKKYVTTRIVSDITNGVRLLKSDVPILVYIVRSTLGSFQTADQYLVGIADEANLRVNDVNQLGSSYSNDVNDFVGTVKTATADLPSAYSKLTQSYGDTLQSKVQSDADLKPVVEGILSEIGAIFDDSISIEGTIDSVFATHLQLVLALDDDLLTFYGTSMCAIIQSLLQVLIENGPNAQFCFSKFGQKVFNFFVLHTYDAADCFRLQLARLDQLRTGVSSIVQLMLHDIDDFIANVESCTLFNDIQNCASFLGPEYQTLFTYTTQKRDYLYRLLTKETNASYLRLAGCFSNSKHLLMLDAETMRTDIDSCELNGPL
ncbi:uncharacterized protein LOC128715211 [Anopheles marshallii]|uniref:uncharacterized protein LOC128715211 n=1 Tax=Anopheles marshallii TaxID=1521116 RepID=UPI00237ACB77|nr:uncharacterized protein LOC128715211 [Anopheles marshallii]